LRADPTALERHLGVAGRAGDISASSFRGDANALNPE